MLLLHPIPLTGRWGRKMLSYVVVEVICLASSSPGMAVACSLSGGVMCVSDPGIRLIGEASSVMTSSNWIEPGTC